MEIAIKSLAGSLGLAMMITCLAAAKAQDILSAMETTPDLGVGGVDNLITTRTNLNPGINTEWKVTLGLINYFPM